MSSSVTPPIAPDKPWLAPLAGFSDLPFRLLCREYGAAVTVTEMVSAKGLIHAGPKNDFLLATCPEDDPLVVQLFGAEPESLGRAAADVAQRGFSWLDLNCGCSVPKVVKTGAGAALLKDTDRLVACASAMVAAMGEGRVGVKLRSGWCADSTCYADVAKRLEDAGVGWLTLHPRTARQGFSGTARWAHLAELKRAVSVPVIASGDLFHAADGVSCLEESGVDAVMYARGALGNPAIFNAHQALTAGTKAPVVDGPSLAKLIRRHVELIHTHATPERKLMKMRTVVPRYVRHVPGASKLRAQLTRLSSYEQLEELLPYIEELGQACHDVADSPPST